MSELETKLADAERFAALVAHELKGRLVTLERYAAGLTSAIASGDNERLRSDARRIQDIARELVETIDALRSLGRGDSVPEETVSLFQAASEAVEWLQESIDAEQIEIVIASDLPTVPGSQILWRQVYRNLIDNAVKACAGVEEPRIEIGCERRDGETVCSVCDNGSGLQADDLSQLFEPHFARGPAAGAGMGMFLVKRIIENSGGRVWAEKNQAGFSVKWTISSKLT